MYHAIVQRIDKKHPLYEWADAFAHAENNFQNATIFRIRNLFTGLNKPEECRHELEQQVIDEFLSTYEKRDPKWNMPTADNWMPTYPMLDDVCKTTKNPDYYASDYTAKTAQASIKQTIHNFDSFFNSIKSYKENPEKFTGRPGLPGYKKKGGVSTFTIDNQEGKIYKDSRGRDELKLPKTKKRLKLGRFISADWTLYHTKVVPDGNTYRLCLVFEDNQKEPDLDFESSRIAAGDMGVDNLISCVNNVGASSLIIGGGPLKSANQFYNKNFAHIQSDETRGGDKKFEMTDDAWDVTHYRADKMTDYFHKSAVVIRNWCVENRIDTFVLGYNRGWKDDVIMRHESKQTFIQIPFAQFSAILKDTLVRAGIKFVEQEESYTSKASSLDRDFIPTFGDEKPESGWKFGGYRSPTTTYYKHNDTGELVEYKVKPRGLYRSRKHGVVNSDLNGAANILLKAFPNAFDEDKGIFPNLFERDMVIVLKHPDDLLSGELPQKQSGLLPSLSKARRLARKSGIMNERGCAMLSSLEINFAKRSPTGIELCG